VNGRGGYVGPDLSDTGRRLEPGWIEAWLSAPEKWKPGTLQPDYGLERVDAQALTAYLMTLSTGSRERRDYQSVPSVRANGRCRRQPHGDRL
jgi:hypothetical protein